MTNTITKATKSTNEIEASAMVKREIAFDVINLFGHDDRSTFTAATEINIFSAENFDKLPISYLESELYVDILEHFKFFDGYTYDELRDLNFVSADGKNKFNCIQFDDKNRKIYIYNPDDLDDCECVVISNIRLTNQEN